MCRPSRRERQKIRSNLHKKRFITANERANLDVIVCITFIPYRKLLLSSDRIHIIRGVLVYMALAANMFQIKN